MDELNTSLLNYRKAFKAKLDAYSSLSMGIPTIEDPFTPKPPPITEPKKPTFDLGSIISGDEPDFSPQEKKPIKRPSKTTEQPTKPKKKTTSTHNPPIFTPPIIDNGRPLPTPSPKKRIISKIITSFSFRFSLAILLLLLL